MAGYEPRLVDPAASPWLFPPRFPQEPQFDTASGNAKPGTPPGARFEVWRKIQIFEVSTCQPASLCGGCPNVSVEYKLHQHRIKHVGPLDQTYVTLIYLLVN